MASVGYWTFFLGNIEDSADSTALINVACVGDSITEWSGYPADLQVMLGDEYVVGNFGAAEAAVSTDWYKPYRNQAAFRESIDFEPDVVVIMLGTNDAHTYQHLASFASDYAQLVAEYQALNCDPTVFLVTPPPIYENKLELSGTNLQEDVIPNIEQVAKQLRLSKIDVNSALANHPEFFDDGVHPNDDGAMVIADEIWDAITLEDYESIDPD
jgi:lysophospholipase L1-like esterase